MSMHGFPGGSFATMSAADMMRKSFSETPLRWFGREPVEHAEPSARARPLRPRRCDRSSRRERRPPQTRSGGRSCRAGSRLLCRPLRHRRRCLTNRSAHRLAEGRHRCREGEESARVDHRLSCCEPAIVRWISSESDRAPIFFIAVARWVSTVLWLMPRT